MGGPGLSPIANLKVSDSARLKRLPILSLGDDDDGIASLCDLLYNPK
jgi:hypothetical protein